MTGNKTARNLTLRHLYERKNLPKNFMKDSQISYSYGDELELLIDLLPCEIFVLFLLPDCRNCRRDNWTEYVDLSPGQ